MQRDGAFNTVLR
jgi:transposase